MRALPTRDDTFHEVGSDSPCWTETVWFAWMVPERQRNRPGWPTTADPSLQGRTGPRR